MSAFEMTYNKASGCYTIDGMPDTVLDIIIDSMWKDPLTHWIAEELSDNEADALAIAAEDAAAAANRWNEWFEDYKQKAAEKRNFDLHEL